MKNLSSEPAAAYQVYGSGEGALFALDPGEEAGDVGKGGYLVGYTGRSVSGMKPGHRICVPANEYGVTLGDLAYQRSLGLVVPDENDIIPVDMTRESLVLSMQDHASGSLREVMSQTRMFHPFVYSYDTDELVEDQGFETLESLELSEYWNSKVGGLVELGVHGVSITPGETAYTPDQVRREAEGMLKRFGTIVIKGARGASGMDMWKDITRMDQVEQVLSDPKFERHAQMVHPHNNQPVGFRVEGWVGTARTEEQYKGRVLGSPAGIVFLKDLFEDSVFLGPTDQLLKDDVHQGNRYPLRPDYAELEDELRVITERVARIAHAAGVRGPLGLDFIVLQKEDSSLNVVVSELNQRWTGQMHVLFKAHEHYGSERPEGRAWMGCNLPVAQGTTRDQYLDWLRSIDAEYSRDGSNPQCLVLNTAPMVDPEGDRMHGIVFAQTIDEVRDLYTRLCGHKEMAMA